MQGGRCLYTGKEIHRRQLFDGSCEIDHILPKERTMDDGIANLALVTQKANQDKNKRTPFEAFGAGYDGQDYANILSRAWKRGRGVYWRFAEDALERFEDEDEFRKRFLNDTRYIARASAKYLSCVAINRAGVIHLNGKITERLRYFWGVDTLIRDLMIAEGRLDEGVVMPSREGETLKETQERRTQVKKIRWDHRHHLLDAIVAACTRRSDVQRLQTLSGIDAQSLYSRNYLEQIREEHENFRGVGICWSGNFRKIVQGFLSRQETGDRTGEQAVSRVVRKADHDPQGQLHAETNYSIICAAPGTKSQYVARDHIKIETLTKKQIDALGVPESAIQAMEAAQKAGERFYWGGEDPVTAIRQNLVPSLVKLKTTLLKYINEAPPECYENAKSEGGIEKAKVIWATKKYIEQTKQRRFTRIQVLSLRILKGAERHDSRIKRASPTSGNDRLIYYRDDEGKRGVEVITTLDGNDPGFVPEWKRQGARPLFTLRANDLVEMLVDPNHPEKGRGIYRLVQFSYAEALDLQLLPVEEARAIKELPKSHKVRIRSIGAFNAREPLMILLDQTGRVRWRSPLMN